MVFTIDFSDDEFNNDLELTSEIKRKIKDEIENSLLSFYNNFNEMPNLKKFNIKNQKSIIKSIR